MINVNNSGFILKKLLKIWDDNWASFISILFILLQIYC